MQRAPSPSEWQNTGTMQVNTSSAFATSRGATNGREWKLCTQVGLGGTGRSTWGGGKEQEQGSKLDLPWLLSRSCSPCPLPNSFGSKRVKDRPWCRWEPRGAWRCVASPTAWPVKAPVTITAQGAVNKPWAVQHRVYCFRSPHRVNTRDSLLLPPRSSETSGQVTEDYWDLALLWWWPHFRTPVKCHCLKSQGPTSESWYSQNWAP